MNKLRIYQLIHRDLTGQLNHSEEAELDALKTQSEYEHIFAELTTVWSASKNYFPQQKFDVSTAKAKFARRIATDKKRPAKTFSMPWLLAAAAAIVLIIAIGIWLYPSSSAVKMQILEASSDIEYAILPDNTEIWLGQGSMLKYPDLTVPGARNVSLVGEAYFKVASKTNAPFVVDLGKNNYAEVIGTAFNVKTDVTTGTAEVKVNEGIVRLYNTSSSRMSTTLSAGQGARIQAGTGQIESIPIVGSYSFFANELNFKNTPLPDVFDKIGTFFEVEITYDRPSINGCRVNSPLMDDFGLQEIFEVLEGLYPGMSIENTGEKNYTVSGLSCAE